MSGGDDVASFRFVHRVPVRFHDLDAMGHAHHSLPLIYIEEARAAYWREVVGRPALEHIDYVIGEATVRYHARITFPDELAVGVRVSRVGGRSFAMQYEVHSSHGELLASAETLQVMYDYASSRSKPVPDAMRRAIVEFETGTQNVSAMPADTSPMIPPSR